MKLKFSDCFKLNQDAQELIHQSVCNFTWLPGREAPTYFTHRATGSSLAIHLAQWPVSRFWEFQPCVVLALGQTNNDFEFNNIQIKCHFRGKHGDSILLHEWRESLMSPLPDFRDQGAPSDHLIIFSPYSWLDQDDDPEAEVSHNEILLEFSSTASFNCKIREYGVRLLDVTYVCEEEESNTGSDEKMSNSWVCLGDEPEKDEQETEER